MLREWVRGVLLMPKISLAEPESTWIRLRSLLMRKLREVMDTPMLTHLFASAFYMKVAQGEGRFKAEINESKLSDFRSDKSPNSRSFCLGHQIS